MGKGYIPSDVKFEGVTFIAEAVRKMTRAAFIRTHLDAFWKDRSESDRRKMLSDVYRKITGESSEEEVSE